MQGHGMHKSIEYSSNEFILLRNTTRGRLRVRVRVRVRGRGRMCVRVRVRGRGRVITLTTGLCFYVP